MNLQIVFSQCPEGVSEHEFNEWYDAHLPEILTIPGFVSAKRYRLAPAVADPDAPEGFGYLAVYETEGDVDTLMAAMASSNLATKESYVKFKEHDEVGPPLPEWWDRVRFASWNCIELGDRVKAL